MESKEFLKINESSHLIPVHINKARDNNYFYDWSSDCKGWVRGNKIPDHLKKAYNNPIVKSNY